MVAIFLRTVIHSSLPFYHPYASFSRPPALFPDSNLLNGAFREAGDGNLVLMVIGFTIKTVFRP